jgi:hypothetical protein
MVFEILRITVKTPILQIAPETDRLPVQFVIGTTESYERMNEASQALMDKTLRSGTFAYMDTDLKIDKPQTTIEIDRDKAAQPGLTMRDIGDALASMLSGGYVNYFGLAGRSCKVIPQVMQRDRLNAGQLRNYYIIYCRRGIYSRFNLCAPQNRRSAGVTQPFPATQFRHDLRRARFWCYSRRGAGYVEKPLKRRAAPGLQH